MMKEKTAKIQQCSSQVSFLPSLNDESNGTVAEHETESRIIHRNMASGLLRTNNAPQKICELESKTRNICYNCNRYDYDLSGRKTEVYLLNYFFLNIICTLRTHLSFILYTASHHTKRCD